MRACCLQTVLRGPRFQNLTVLLMRGGFTGIPSLQLSVIVDWHRESYTLWLITPLFPEIIFLVPPS